MKHVLVTLEGCPDALTTEDHLRTVALALSKRFAEQRPTDLVVFRPAVWDTAPVIVAGPHYSLYSWPGGRIHADLYVPENGDTELVNWLGKQFSASSMARHVMTDAPHALEPAAVTSHPGERHMRCSHLWGGPLLPPFL